MNNSRTGKWTGRKGRHKGLRASLSLPQLADANQSLPDSTDLAMWQTPQAPPHCESTCKATVGRLRNITTLGLYVSMTMRGLEIYKTRQYSSCLAQAISTICKHQEHEMAGIVTRKSAEQLGKALAPPSSAPKVLPLITITVTIAQQYPMEPNTPPGGKRRTHFSEKRPGVSRAATGSACFPYTAQACFLYITKACFLFTTNESLSQWDVNGSSRWLDLQPG
jgi:hypothetical protein